VKSSAITGFRRLSLALAAVAAGLLLIASRDIAQSEPKSSGLFKASPQQRGEPVKISSATFEIHPKKNMATFSGGVQVVQGDTDVRCKVLIVYYDNERGKSASKNAEGGGSQQIRRMEAKGSVVVTQKEQRAVGERAEFDMRTNTVTLIGNVVVTSAENVMRGQRLIVDLTTGVSRMESGGGRVEGVFNSKSPPKMGKPH
jgi:lipopolysaccharide export system protein LptA